MLSFYVCNLESTLIKLYLLPRLTVSGLVDSEGKEHPKRKVCRYVCNVYFK